MGIDGLVQRRFELEDGRVFFPMNYTEVVVSLLLLKSHLCSMTSSLCPAPDFLELLTLRAKKAQNSPKKLK